jgi:hypothetical protein
MTRINSAIPVKFLTDEHLLAEHREIKRLPGILFNHKGKVIPIPTKFCLGKGHVLFFMNKFLFTYNRYKLIYNECLNRGFNVKDYSGNWQLVPPQYCLPYITTEEEEKLLIDRISDRIINSSRSCFHYYGNKVSKRTALLLLTGKLEDMPADDKEMVTEKLLFERERL